MGGIGKNVKLLIIVAVVIGAVAIGLLVSTVVLGVRLKNKSDELTDLQNSQPKYCTNPECVRAAGNMIQGMDLVMNPCTDFYQFSCGAWVKQNPIPDTSSSWNQFNILREQLSRDVRGILESDIDDIDPEPVKLAKTFYKSCMEQNTTDQLELHSLIEEFLKVEDARVDLGLKLAELRRRIGAPIIANMYVELDEENASKYIIYVDQPTFGINRAFLVNTPHPTRQAYRSLIEQTWPLVYPLPETNYSKIADDILEFETRIAEVTAPPEKRRNRTELYNLMNIREFGEHTVNASSHINWEVYVTEMFKDVVESHDLDLGPIPDLNLVVRDISYFTEFGHVLSQTNIETIVNYLRWRLIYGLGNDVSGKLRDLFFDFTKKTQGTMYPSPMWKICSDKANSFFGMAISRNYVQEVLSEDFQQKMGELIRNIQDAMYENIDTVEWISSSDTREKAKEKARKMKEFVGYPDWLLNNSTALDHHYKGLLVSSPNNHFHNYLNISYWRNMEGLRRLKDDRDTNRWITDPTVVNAFYSSTYNSISFPAGILQPPFYFTGNPIQAINYGAIGMVIAHEITHGFDDRGRQSDGDGNLINWWDEGTINHYVERTKCFINQYSEYTAEEANNLKLNGNNTLGENIADNSLATSFNAYKAFIRQHGTEPRLPGLDYTPEQLFFIAFAQIWCGSYTPLGMENQILTGAHSPNRFRVQGVLQNSREFAETWNCPLPDENTRCKIW
ncbi:membrane metallo-endopeptidase-like 1 isoform X1 [Folsomia candida]|uniref:membrane metallo-endopeptidase-like 1 isoform X1 n=1 Tax=Folsomia candida TaxID=158441 RepID=UPI000B8F0A44|nr:membrane metallo-endopeptidase-like 1 isoform X1 [Folsomia candida]